MNSTVTNVYRRQLCYRYRWSSNFNWK